MKLFEKIVLAIVALGFILKVTDIAGGTLLVVIGLSFLSVIYMFFGWWLFKIKKENYNNIGLSIVAGLGLANGAIGIMYKLQCWPGAAAMLMTTVVFLLPFPVVFMIRFLNDREESPKKNYDKLMLVRCIVCVGLVAIIAVTPLRVFAGMQHFNDPEEKKVYMRYIEDPTCVECYHDWVNYRMPKDSIHNR